MVANERQGRCRVSVKADGIIANLSMFTPSALAYDVAYYRETLTVVRPFVFASLELVGKELPWKLDFHSLRTL